MMLSQARPGPLSRPAWARSSEQRNSQRGERGRRDALVGIDLGTTNSSVAILGEAGPQVLADDFGRKSIPSEVVVVNGQVCVGCMSLLLEQNALHLTCTLWCYRILR
jgi:hypothetical protein